MDMKNIKTILLSLMMLPSFICVADNPNDYLKVMSYNVRFGTADDGENSWQFRCPATIAMLDNQKPDIFGVQEALSFQLKYITANCKQYKCVGVGREDGKAEGEFMSIFWNKKRIKLLKWGTFWLSETPEVPSMGWDAHCKRTATWALMKDKRSGKKFYYVNTHLDHRGVEAQKKGLKLIVDRIDEINPEGYPMVLTGDFNVTPDNTVLSELDLVMDSARKVAKKTDNCLTFNGWGKTTRERIIDYIYIKGFSACKEYQTVVEKYSGCEYVSDHYPIVATLLF